jgi:hypothetical protein
MGIGSHFNCWNMKRFSKLIIISSAILLAIISYYFFAGWFNLIPWAVFVLLTGYFNRARREIIFNEPKRPFFLFEQIIK